MKTIFALKWFILVWVIAIGFSTYLFDYRKEHKDYFEPKPRECYIVDVVNGRNESQVIFTYGGMSYTEPINSTNDYVSYKENIGKKTIINLSSSDLNLHENGRNFNGLYGLMCIILVLSFLGLIDASTNPDLYDVNGYTMVTFIVYAIAFILPFCANALKQ